MSRTYGAVPVQEPATPSREDDDQLKITGLHLFSQSMDSWWLLSGVDGFCWQTASGVLWCTNIGCLVQAFNCYVGLSLRCVGVCILLGASYWTLSMKAGSPKSVVSPRQKISNTAEKQ